VARTLVRYRTIRGTIFCETGLRIGGSNENIEIGGLENTIIRHPLTNEPYVPGSSLKGKIRSLLEYRLDRRDRTGQSKGRVDRDNGEPCECGRCQICRVFGPHKNTRHDQGPTRALFRDAILTAQSRADLAAAQTSKGVMFSEIKTENMINRNIGMAEHPRTQERVPAGTSFDFEISVRIFNDDNEQEILGLLNQGLELLQQDYLGASGSRGYGKVALDYKVE
jgi:CRISPR-associated protein Csm3